jgi:hypothetical protein
MSFDNHNFIIKKFQIENLGEAFLVSDLLEDYDDVHNNFFKGKSQGSQKISNNVFVKGLYDVFIKQKKYGNSGVRAKEVIMFNSEYDYEYNLSFTNSNKWEQIFDLEINNSTCLFLSDRVLENKLELDIFLEKWMSYQYSGNISDLTIDGYLIGFGVSSGFGDGVYDFYGYYDDNKLIGLKVEFITDETEAEFEDDQIFESVSNSSDDSSDSSNATFNSLDNSSYDD